jgi:SPP1 family predicted phage head-tail adaptor
MRHHAVLEQPVHKDDYEDHEEEWEQIGHIRFSMRATQGSDTDSDDRIDHVRKYSIRTRWRTDITPNMRLNHDGHLLNIVGLPIDNTLRHRWLDIDCEEVVM